MCYDPAFVFFTLPRAFKDIGGEGTHRFGSLQAKSLGAGVGGLLVQVSRLDFQPLVAVEVDLLLG